MSRIDLREPIEQMHPDLWVRYMKIGLVAVCQRGHSVYTEDVWPGMECPECAYPMFAVGAPDATWKFSESKENMIARLRDFHYEQVDGRKDHEPRDSGKPRPQTRIGEACLRLREHLQCSQKELAKIVGVPYSLIGRLEYGKQKAMRKETSLKFRQLCLVVGCEELIDEFMVPITRPTQSHSQSRTVGRENYDLESLE